MIIQSSDLEFDLAAGGFGFHNIANFVIHQSAPNGRFVRYFAIARICFRGADEMIGFRVKVSFLNGHM